MKIIEVDMIAKDQALIRLEDGSEIEVTIGQEGDARSLMIIVQGEPFDDVTISQVRGRGSHQ